MFPEVSNKEKRFLNSGGYIGYVHDIYSLICHLMNEYNVLPSDSDQKNFQKIFLDPNLRKKHNIKLDHNSTIFFNIYGAADDAEFHCIDGTLRK